MVKLYPSKEGDPYYDALMHHDLFPAGTRAHIELFAPGEKLEHPNEPISHLRVLLSGQAKIYMIHGGGRQSILQFLGPGDYIGEFSLLGVEVEPKYVEAISACAAISLPFSENRARLLGDAPFLQKMCVFLIHKLHARSERLTQNLNYPLKHRLASLILMVSQDGVYPLRHTEAAEYLGVSYRHLLYTLAQFRKDGLVEKDGRIYRVRNEGALRALAGDVRS
ncbi:MAG: transcriptional regulator YeiL [Christensenellales bacterium]|jgi:CRP/FNR family putative post-exponential-phase nitrogen-starvation transcriptional regulator